MSKTFGITATTARSMTHVLGLAVAAHRKGYRIDVFLSGEGVHLTQDSRFAELLEAGRVGVCEVSYMAAGYRKEALAGMRDKDFVTQLRNAEMVERCDRYVVL